MNKKIIALSVFFILGISFFTIISFNDNDKQTINYIETYGVHYNFPLSEVTKSKVLNEKKYLVQEKIKKIGNKY